MDNFDRLYIILMLWGNILLTNYSIHKLKTDPVCEHARSALDLLNSRAEERINGKPTK